MHDTHDGPKFEAIFGLAIRKDRRIKETLITELEDIDELGSQILQAIEEFNDKAFIPLLEKQILKNKLLKKVEESWLLNTLQKLKATD